MSNQCEELTTRLSKYEQRVNDLESQNEKHNEMHEKMKQRLKDLQQKLNEQRNELHKLQSNETLMRNTNLQLFNELNSLKHSSTMMTMLPRSASNNFQQQQNRFYQDLSSKNLIMNSQAQQKQAIYDDITDKIKSSRNINESLNTVRSIVENSIQSMKTK